MNPRDSPQMFCHSPAGLWLRLRVCLKNAFRKMCVTICGRFCPDEGVVAGYGNRIRTKYTAKWGVQIAEMIFQTRSSVWRERWEEWWCKEKGGVNMQMERRSWDIKGWGVFDKEEIFDYNHHGVLQCVWKILSARCEQGLWEWFFKHALGSCWVCDFGGR